MNAIRIIGVDPGSRITGYGIVDASGTRLVHVASGFVRVGEGAWSDRLRKIFEDLSAIIDTHAPRELAIEKVFLHRNPSSALKLGQARGVAILAGAVRSLSVHEYSPNEIKQAVTGKGHASKEQIQYMTRVLLSLREPPQTDQADALAVAICRAHLRTTMARRERMLASVAGGSR
ncbi:MAG: crossover junction endodeoxyribonuclease RuvC [Thiotrichales bacterium]|nr:crossover junction endodeoxyribonuclease RuvC [Thiotrichales bacterium]